jgi:YihY family inner membrane protein
LLEYLEIFSTNVKALNMVSFAVLIFTSVALLNTIESALNVVWRVSSSFSLSKIASFWMVISLGPFLIALSIYWTAKVRALGVVEEWSWLYFIVVSYVIPVLTTTLGLFLLYYKLPAARVRLGDALFGAVLAAVLFEFVKRAFAYYVGLSSAYSTVYGVLTTIPLFLFWLYVAWLVMLFGAEASYQSGSIHILYGMRRFATDLGEIGALLGLRILCAVGSRFLEGHPPPSEGEIAVETGSDPVLVRSCLHVLTESHLISVPDEQTHARALIVAPESLTLGTVFNVFRSKQYRRRLEQQGAALEANEFWEAFGRLPAALLDKKRIVDVTLAEFLVAVAEPNKE